MTDAALFTPIEPEAEPARRRSRRRPLTGSERSVLVGMIAGAALLGALSVGAPTGHAVVDATYRAAFVAVTALAASRSRRWALVIGSSVACVASIGIGLMFAAAALGMTIVLIARQMRNRAFGACVGAFVGMACLRLDVGGFLGAESLVAGLAVLPLWWSGYRVSSRGTRRAVRWALVVAGTFAVVAVGMSGYQAISYAGDLGDAVTSTTQGISAVEGGKTDSASRLFVRASTSFGSVADAADAWYWFPTRLVPVLSQNLATLPTVARSGQTLTDAAATAASNVDYDRLRREGGGVDLALLNEFRGPVLEVSSRLRAVSEDITELRSPWIVEPLDDRLDEFDDKVRQLRRQTEVAALAVQFGPQVFGGDGARHYLVLLGNPAEARDLGGHIGNFAELTIDGGVLTLDRVGVPRELSQPDLDAAVDESGLLPPSMAAMRPATFPQNWGTSIDFPTDAKVAARLYSTAVGHPIDGVLYADPFALAAMLSITGPIEVPEVGVDVTSETAVEFLTVDQYTLFPNQNDADDALTEFVRTLFDRLTTTTLPAPAELGRRFGPLVAEGRFRFFSLRDGDDRLLGPLGLDVGFESVEGDDALAVVSRNANPSKVDAFLYRSTAGDISWDPATGSVRSEITVTLRNEAPPGGLPEYVIGNSSGLPEGTNITDLAVISPFEATRVTVDGVDAPVSPLWDDDVWRHSVRVSIPPGATMTVRFELEGEVVPGSEYRLRYGGQPLVNDGPVSLRVASTGAGDSMVDGPGIDVDGAVATAEFTDVGRYDLSLRVR